MHGIYFISILYAIFSLSLTCFQPIFWFSKETIFMLSKTYRFETKNSKKTVKKIVSAMIKTSEKIALK